MAELLELHAENRFKIIAFSKAARVIESLPEDISIVCREKRLQSIPGVGKAIAQKVEEYLKTGQIEAHQELLAKTPPGLVKLLQISGLGPKTVFMLHEKLNITNLEELENAAKEHRIRRLPRMGPTRETNILKSIERYKKRSTCEAWKAWSISLQRAAFAGRKKLWAILIFWPPPAGRRK
jgi:DNA polymerase (family 10)